MDRCQKKEEREREGRKYQEATFSRAEERKQTRLLQAANSKQGVWRGELEFSTRRRMIGGWKTKEAEISTTIEGTVVTWSESVLRICRAGRGIAKQQQQQQQEASGTCTEDICTTHIILGNQNSCSLITERVFSAILHA